MLWRHSTSAPLRSLQHWGVLIGNQSIFIIKMTRNRYSERALCFQKIIFIHQLGPLPSCLLFPSLSDDVSPDSMHFIVLLSACMGVWVVRPWSRLSVLPFFSMWHWALPRSRSREVCWKERRKLKASTQRLLIRMLFKRRLHFGLRWLCFVFPPRFLPPLIRWIS